MVETSMKNSGCVLVSFLGWSGSGKTTFIEACISTLTAMHYRVFALKSTHRKVELDTPGTDSFRFRSAGASGVGLLAKNGSAVFFEPGTMTGSFPFHFFPDADFILAEGYHGDSDLQFEIFRPLDTEPSAKGLEEELDGVITNSPDLYPRSEGSGLHFFPLNDPEPFIRYLTTVGKTR